MTHRSKRIEVGRLFAVATAGLALALPAPAFAAQSSQNAYSSPAGAVQGEVLGQAGQSPGGQSPGGVLGSTSEAGAPAAAGGQQAPAVSAEQRPSSSSKLPFTGLDIGLLLGAGGLFMGVGLAMRRLSTRPDFA